MSLGESEARPLGMYLICQKHERFSTRADVACSECVLEAETHPAPSVEVMPDSEIIAKQAAQIIQLQAEVERWKYASECRIERWLYDAEVKARQQLEVNVIALREASTRDQRQIAQLLNGEKLFEEARGRQAQQIGGYRVNERKLKRMVRDVVAIYAEDDDD